MNRVAQSASGLLALGFVLGLRHALDADHLAAVATLVSRRGNARSGPLIGAFWGLGHTATLLAASVVLIALQLRIPPNVARLLELGVAAMLIALGANLLRRLAQGAAVHHHRHAHGDLVHSHPHVHQNAHRHDAIDGAGAAPGGHHGLGWTARHLEPLRVRRPFLIGCAHGLAGSAGLMLVVLATIPSPALAIAYVVTFGVGSIAGMTAMTAAVSLPLAFLHGRFERAWRWLEGSAALASIGVGLAIALGA
jgi:ABC-type nickel/cobalt efflux system permease component RcnA